MKNPNLTFVTPSILTGDRSMSNVIWHEISHSWTGNLVTNKKWKNFWINEGFTIFMERKLSKILLGEEMSNLESIIGYNCLTYSIKLLGEDSNFTSLSPDFSGIEPDDGFSNIPYEIVYRFLCYLEKKVGENDFQQIMRNYIGEYKYESVDWTDLKKNYEHFVNDKYENKKVSQILNQIDWNRCITEKGYPRHIIKFKSYYIDEIDNLLNKFKNNEKKENSLTIFREWHTNVKTFFIAKILNDNDIDNFDENIILKLKKDLNLVDEFNDDIKEKWYEITLRKGMNIEIENIKNFLTICGRIKYLKLLYIACIKHSFDDAKIFFDENKLIYHPIARKIIHNIFDSK